MSSKEVEQLITSNGSVKKEAMIMTYILKQVVKESNKIAISLRQASPPALKQG
jgi:hypothetical protein